MTNEEALKLIKKTDYCYVVWSITENVVVAVHPVPRGATPAECFAMHSKMHEHKGPTKARFLDPKSVTLSTLQEEQQDTESIKHRQRIRQSWQTCSTDELLSILERADFPDPTYDPRSIIEQLYYSPARKLSTEQLKRLDAVAASGERLEPRVLPRVEYLLAVLNADRDRLERAFPPADWFAFVNAAGDLQLDARHVVNDFVGVVRSPTMFGPRFEAMLALGKIGASAGDDAAAAIEEHIYDSSEGVAAMRALCVRRIRTPPSDWTPCRGCIRGLVPKVGSSISGFAPCRVCNQLGWRSARATAG